MLQLDQLEIFLHDDRLLAVDHAIEPGDVLTVMGASGAGKSTLLHAVGGFLEAPFTMRGRIIVAGRDVSRLAPEARGIGLLFQDPLLFPHMSIGANLAFAIPSGGGDRGARIGRALETVALAGFQSRDPATLSGGQKARVALMRALLAEPRAILLDEPFNRLDRALRADIRGVTFKTIRDAGLPAILVTHDPEDAAAAGGEIIELGAD